jgi:two-component system heavy metal sensor histidine kinase CusS
MTRQRKLTSSLRARLVIATAVACVIVFCVAGVALFVLLRASFTEEFDRSLLAKAQALQAMTDQDDTGIKFEADLSNLSEYRAGQRNDFFEMWSQDGKVIAKSASLGETAHIPLPSARPDHPVYQPLELRTGQGARTITVNFIPRPENEGGVAEGGKREVTMVVARSTRGLEHELRETAWLIVFVFGVATLAAVVAMITLVTRGLRPVASLANHIARTDEHNLAAPIPLDQMPTELEPIVSRLNDLLARIDSVMAREKAFTADVAHELRTPISGLEAALEVCASKPREAPEYRRVVERCLSTVRAMHAMVNNLLLMARADAGQIPVNRQAVSVQEVLRESWALRESQAQSRELSIQWDVPDELKMMTDPELLRIVINNLLDNAVNHCNAGGLVRISAVRSEINVLLTVANSGCTLSPEDVTQIFERFWTADRSRTATGAHAGIGLSLSRKIASLLGASMSATADGGVFSIHIACPIGDLLGIKQPSIQTGRQSSAATAPAAVVSTPR